MLFLDSHHGRREYSKWLVFALSTRGGAASTPVSEPRALLFNTANENTAFGAAALLFNTTGVQNTAVGAAALLNNTTGNNNTAIGSDHSLTTSSAAAIPPLGRTRVLITQPAATMSISVQIYLALLKRTAGLLHREHFRRNVCQWNPGSHQLKP